MPVQNWPESGHFPTLRAIVLIISALSNGEVILSEIQQPIENMRVYGWALALASPLALVGLANHPVAPGGDFIAALKLMAQIGYINSIIHGVLIALMFVLVFGFVGLSRRLGFDRPLVQAGFIAQVVGAFAGVSAAVIDGFVFRQIATVYSSATPEQADMVRGLFNLAGSIVYTWGRLWLIGLSLAMFFWSLVLVKRTGIVRVIGLYGVVAGALAAGGSLLGILPMMIWATAAIFGSVALWGTMVGILILRNKL